MHWWVLGQSGRPMLIQIPERGEPVQWPSLMYTFWRFLFEISQELKAALVDYLWPLSPTIVSGKLEPCTPRQHGPVVVCLSLIPRKTIPRCTICRSQKMQLRSPPKKKLNKIPAYLDAEWNNRMQVHSIWSWTFATESGLLVSLPSTPFPILCFCVG